MQLRAFDAILQAIDEIRRLEIVGPFDMQVTMCFRSRSGETFEHMQVPTYEHALQLAARLRDLGFGMSILHPDTIDCDFVFEDLTQSTSAHDWLLGRPL